MARKGSFFCEKKMSNEKHTALTDFSGAIYALKQGKKVARNGWNGKGMWLIRIDGEAVAQAIADRYGDGDAIPVLEAIYMKTATGELVPWLASQTDIFAEDWVVIQ